MKRAIFTFVMVLLWLPQAHSLDRKDITVKITINQSPSITHLTPHTGDTAVSGDRLRIEVTASDPNTGHLEGLRYKFTTKDSNGNIRRTKNWSSDNFYEFTLTDTDIGSNTVVVEVKDPLGLGSAKDAEIYVFRATLALPQ